MPLIAAPVPRAGTIIWRRLAEGRRRMFAQLLVDAISAAAVVMSVVFCFLEATGRADARAALIAGVLSAIGVIGWAFLQKPTLAQTAQLLDDRGTTRDRFQTAIEFARRPATTPLEALALDECERYARDFPVRRWTRICLPRLAAFALIPLAGIALLSWGAFSPRRQPLTAVDAAISKRAAELQRIALAVRQADPKSADLAKMADAIEKSAQRLKASERGADAEKQKAALREMSSLQAMLNAMRAARDQPVSQAELSALAAALAANDAAKPVADALHAGDLGAAASQLEKLLQTLKDRGDSAAATEQLARSLQEQANKLTAAQINEIARQMQAAGQGAQAGQPQLSKRALTRLAQLLRQAGQNGAGSPSNAQGEANGRPMTDREMQSLADALENMKNGLRPGSQPGKGDQPGEGAPGGDSAPAVVESFSKDPSASAGQIPGGQPGSEHDEGHSDVILSGSPPPDVKAQGPATRLTGAQGKGESLQQFIGAANDGSRATRAYRESFDRLVPAAQNAVEQEKIPLGSRAFVRRYFENIRPTE